MCYKHDIITFSHLKQSFVFPFALFFVTLKREFKSTKNVTENTHPMHFDFALLDNFNRFTF